MTALLHFDKLFQIPLILAHGISGIAYRDMIEAFIAADPARYPMIAEIHDFFEGEAEAIQKGGAEYVFSKEYLNIFWPADEYIFVKLTAEGKFDAFYDEAAGLLLELIRQKSSAIDLECLDDALRLNRRLVKEPFVSDDITVRINYNIMEFYQGIRNGEPIALTRATNGHQFDRSSQRWHDFQAWCREVVWWGNKKGAYLYSNLSYERELAGHY